MFTPRLAPRIVPWVVLGLIAIAVPVVHLLVVTWEGFNRLVLAFPFLVFINWLYLFLRYDRRCPDTLFLASGRLYAEWHKEHRTISAALAEVRLHPAGSGAHYQVTVTGDTFPISCSVSNFTQLASSVAEAGGSVDSGILDEILKRGMFREFGPKTDPSKMSRKELFRSAKFFFFGALVASVVLSATAVGALGDRATPEEHPFMLFAMFISFLVFSMGVLGGIYLALAGLFSKRA